MATQTHHSNKRKRKRESSGKEVRKKQTERKQRTRKKEPTSNQKREYSTKRKKKKITQLYIEIGSSLLMTCVLIWFLSIFLFTFSKVEGYSMMPTLAENEVVYVNKRVRIKRFSLVYFEAPDQHEKNNPSCDWIARRVN